MPIALPITDEQRATRRNFLSAFGLGAPAALCTPSPLAVMGWRTSVPVLTARDVYELHLEAAINALPPYMQDAAADPNGVLRALLTSTAMAAALVFDTQQQLLARS